MSSYAYDSLLLEFNALKATRDKDVQTALDQRDALLVKNQMLRAENNELRRQIATLAADLEMERAE